MSEQKKQISRRDLLKMMGGGAAGMSLAKLSSLGGAAALVMARHAVRRPNPR